jgi:hypothetical protein
MLTLLLEGALTVLLVAGLASALWRYRRRRAVARIAPVELRARLERRDRFTLVDLRNWRDVLASGEVLPTARVAGEADLVAELEAGRVRGELILYCG